VDTTSFFTLRAEPDEPTGLRTEEWEALLAATNALRFRPGDVVVRAGERDRAVYFLLDGRLESDGGAVTAPATVGVAAFVDGLPQAETLRAATHGELARLSWDAFEALSARDAPLGRAILLDLASALAARLRA
jgi:CRP/FNR family transcriptional regulator, cyclic AMP receptor protein